MLAVLLAIVMLISSIPTGMFVSVAAASDSDVTITVVDSNGDVVVDSALSVKVTRVYTLGNRTLTQNVTVTNLEEDGKFGYDYSINHSRTKYYTVNVSLTADGRTYTASEQVAKNADSVVITLENYIQEDRWETFDIYYIADGHFPKSFYGYGAPEDYGPARNDTASEHKCQYNRA